MKKWHDVEEIQKLQAWVAFSGFFFRVLYPKIKRMIEDVEWDDVRYKVF